MWCPGFTKFCFQIKLVPLQNGGVYVIVDPISTLVFACLVCATTYPFLVELVWVLLESAPKGVDVTEVAKTLVREVPGVVGVHCLHVWQLTPSEVCLTAHIHVHTPPPPPAHALGDTMRAGSAGGGSVGMLGSVWAAAATSGFQRLQTHQNQHHEAVLKKATRTCARRFGINHVTLQVTAVAACGGLARCGDVDHVH